MKGELVKLTATLSGLVFAGIWLAMTPETVDEPYYPYCSNARAAGVAPIYEGEPGYRSALDADNDGVACEPYPRH